MIGKYTGILSLFLIVSFQMFSQSEKVDVSFESSDKFIGQSFEIIYKLPKTNQITYPVLNDTIDGFNILSKWDTLLVDDKNIYTKLNVVIFDTGVYTLRPLAFYINSDTILSPPVKIKVNIPPLQDEIEIYDIKENISFFDDRWILGLVVLLIVIAIFLIINKYVFKNKKSAQTTENSIYSLEDQIIKGIRDQTNLYEKNSLQPGEYYFKIDSLIRDYLEKKYKQPFLESTTSEVLSMIASLPLSIHYINVLKKFFKYSEIVKFAKALDNKDVTSDLIQNLLLFLESQKQNPFNTQIQEKSIN